MTPVQFVESLLEGYRYTITPIIPTNAKVGIVANKIDVSSGGRYHRIYVGETGIHIWPDTTTMSKEFMIILYADPEFKTKLKNKLHQAIP